MRLIERESSTVYMYHYEDWTFFIDTTKDKYTSIMDKENKLLEYSDNDLDIFLNSFDNDLVGYWDEITKVE